MAEEINNQDNNDKAQRIDKYYSWLFYLALVGAVSIIGTACYTMFIQKDHWTELAKTLIRPNTPTLPRRGNIYSYDNQLMATSVPRYYTYLDFQADGFNVDTFYHSARNGLDSLAICLTRKFSEKNGYKGYIPRGGFKHHLEKGYKSKSRQYPLIPKRISYSDLKEISKFPYLRIGKNKSGFYNRALVQRERPFGRLAARTIGDIYGEIDTSGVTKGKNGLELQYDSLLRGKPGLKATRRIAGRWTNVSLKEATEGMDIYTTIDIDIQDITQKALEDMLINIDAASGTAVVMEVATGEIKAITNLGRIAPGVYGETMNHAVADETEPGSTFKVASIMVALEDGVCHPQDSVDVGNGIYMYKGQRMTDHNMNKGGYHEITVEKSIWYSSNIGVAKTILKGYEHNPTKFVEGLYRIGMTADLHLDIPGAGHPKIRRPDDSTRYWSKTTLPWMSFGYETQIPPISTLAFYNAIANGGTMMRPFFVKEIKNREKTVKTNSPEVLIPSICSQKTLHIIQDMLVGVVEEGTGKAVHSDIIPIAGKTGTAQIASGGVYKQAGHQVSFAGYFPADKPKYSCIVVIRQPRIGYPSGGTMSGGVFKVIAEKIYANHSPISVKDMEPDSTGVFLPHLKSGSKQALKNVLGEFNIHMDADSTETDWVRADRIEEKNCIKVHDISLRSGLVPSVYGMGAKDAIFLLESAGLRVALSGTGRVSSQSIPPGSRITNGRSILITLK